MGGVVYYFWAAAVVVNVAAKRVARVRLEQGLRVAAPHATILHQMTMLTGRVHASSSKIGITISFTKIRAFFSMYSCILSQSQRKYTEKLAMQSAHCLASIYSSMTDANLSVIFCRSSSY